MATLRHNYFLEDSEPSELAGLSDSPESDPGRTSLLKILRDCPRLFARPGNLGAPNNSKTTTMRTRPVQPPRFPDTVCPFVVVSPLYQGARRLFLVSGQCLFRKTVDRANRRRWAQHRDQAGEACHK